MKIQAAGENNISDIIAIAERTWWPAYSPILSAEQIRYMLDTLYSESELRSQILSGEQTYLLLSSEGSAKGFASFGIKAEHPEVVRIHKLYVLPEAHKKGYGEALVTEVRSRVAAQGLDIIELNVNRYNPAKSFYERMGFRVVREEDIPIGPYWMNDYVMRLDL